MKPDVWRGAAVVLGALSLFSVSTAGCGDAVIAPASAPPPAIPASASGRAAAPDPLPTVALQLALDDDFIRPLGQILPERAVDEKALLALLPSPLAGEWRAASGELDRYDARQAKSPATTAWGGPAAARLERVIKRLAPPEAVGERSLASPGAGLLAAALLERRLVRTLKRHSVGPSDRARGASLEAGLGGLFERAASQSPPGSQVQAWAAQQGAIELEREGRGADAALLWASMVKTGAADGRAEALTRLGTLLVAGPQAALERGLATFTDALEDPGALDPPVRAAATHGRMLAAYRLHRWDQATRDAGQFLELPAMQGPPTLGTEGALRLAADAAERLAGGGGVDEPSLSPRVAQDIALRLAWRAVRRGDLAGASGLARSALARSSAALHAPNALKTLLAVAERSGDPVASEELSRRLLVDYGPTSPWAEAQRRQRDRTGWPSEQVIADASKSAAAARPESHTEQLEALAGALTRLCVEPEWWRARLAGARPGEARLDFVAAVTPGEAPVVTVTRSPGDEALAGAAECIERLGPALLARAPASVQVTARF